MKRFTLRMYAFAAALLTAFWCVSMASAADYPTLSELYGRYTFNGAMTSLAEEDNETALEPVSRNGYTMVVMPGAGENEVQIRGFFGYGGGLTATYNEADGTLFCSQTVFFICANVNFGSAGMMSYVDAGIGKTLDLTFHVGREDGQIVITAAEPITATAMDGSYNGDKWTYAAGYTLTKQSVSVPLDMAVGKYEYESENVVNTTLEDVWEFFDLSVVPSKNEGKVIVSGLFDLSDEIEADYYADGGVILLPHDYTFSNGMYMGNNEENMTFSQEPAPYLLVDEDKISSPSSFIVNGEYDEVLTASKSFSFFGGEGKKVGGSSVKAVSADNSLSVVVEGSAIRVNTSDASMINVFGVQGTLVGKTAVSSAVFNVTPGVYVVKAGAQTVKVVVK